MRQNSYLPFLGFLLIVGSTTACQDQLPQNKAGEQQAATLPQADADSPRQKAIRLLASRLRWYHDRDSLAEANLGSTDGDILDIGKRRFVFKTRAVLRADLNRVLDSLRRTGPLVMGNAAEATDTVSYKEPSVRSIPGK
jgi:hypothetical protein